MTAIAMVLGSVLGLLAAVFGWLFLDIGLGSALAVYIGTALGFGAMVILPSLMRDKQPEPLYGQPARG